jgi:hypothetical protein
VSAYTDGRFIASKGVTAMSTFWTCLRLNCGAINDRQSCSVCGGECVPGEWVPVAERDRYHEALKQIRALDDYQGVRAARDIARQALTERRRDSR